MAEAISSLDTSQAAPEAVSPTPNTFWRILRYTSRRLLTLFLTVVVSVYLIIIIANFGGYVDEIVAANIRYRLSLAVQDGWLKGEPQEVKDAAFEAAVLAAEEAWGLNDPFMLRTFRWLEDGLTLNWGEVSRYRRGGGGPVRQVVLDALPRSLLLFGTANVILFFITIGIALPLSRRHGNWLDRIITNLTPLSSIPAWVYAILLTTILFKMGIYVTSGSQFDSWPSPFRLAYIPLILRFMLLPTAAIFLSKFFQSVYAWRTFFQLFRHEEYVSLAVAKGLRPRVVERRYILRNALPTILTSFALILFTLWQEVIIIEQFFNMQGIGTLFIGALASFNTPLIVASVTVFGYLLAINVFVLEIAYALLDPRISVNEERQSAVKRESWWKGLVRRLRGILSGESRVDTDLEPDLPQKSVTDVGDLAESRSSPSGLQSLTEMWAIFKPVFRQLMRRPAAVAGLLIISLLIIVSVYVVIDIPYQQAIELWTLDLDARTYNPKNAAPAWVNIFRRTKLPETIVLDPRQGTAQKTVTQFDEVKSEITLSYVFDYEYDAFPQDLVLFVDADYEEKRPFVEVMWYTPDGREFDISTLTVSANSQDIYAFDLDDRLLRRLDDVSPQVALFEDPDQAGTPLQGRYELQVTGLMFEAGSDLDAEFVVYGQVHGLAGTDSKRRDLRVALLWGMPLALIFGVVAALGTSTLSVLLAAAGAWFGGAVDGVIQRLTEVNMVLPFFPVALMIFIMYSKSIWFILAVIVALSIFGTELKNYRALFMQVKIEPYIESAQAYGASDWRVIFRYLLPRVIVVLIPQLVILIPTYVFLEAALSAVGVSDPTLPTWGKLMIPAFTQSLEGRLHMALPAIFLILIGYAFAVVGFSLERILDEQRYMQRPR